MSGIFNSSIFNNAIFNGGDPVTPSCFFNNFEDSGIGDEPPDGWTLRGGGAHTLTVAYSTPPFKRRVATISTPDTDENTAFSVDAIDDFADRADIDVVVAVFRPSSGAVERFAVHVRGQGSGTVTAGYQFAIDFTNSRIRIYKRVASVTTNPFSDLANTHSAGTWRLYRFRANGADLKARAWAVAATEPTTWGLSVTDGSPITAAGWVGVGAYVPSGTATAMLNFFSAATGGDGAHAPILNAAYEAWLDSVAERCYLAEFSAVGYESDTSPVGTKTVNARIANRGYTSAACDSPANTFYPPWITKIPNFRREMSTALSGHAGVSFGSLCVANPAQDLVSGGVRDDWLRMKWNRDYLTLLQGDPSWARFNFRTVLKGRINQPSGKVGEIEFPIADLLDKLDRPLQEERFGSGAPLEGQLIPVLAGWAAYAEPCPTSSASLEQQLNDGPIVFISDVYDDGVSLTSTGHTIGAVAGNTMTSSADHGMAAGYTVEFNSGTPPTPLALATIYYVIATGLTDDDFQLSATLGGSAIVLSSGTTGAGFIARGWSEDLTNGKFTLASSPAGRIVCKSVQEVSFVSGGFTSDLIDRLIFGRAGVPLDFKDEESFDDLAAVMNQQVSIMLYDEQLRALEVLHRICAGTNAWYGFTPDGLLQVGRILLPSGDPAMTFYERDVKRGSLVLEGERLPVNTETLVVRSEKRWLRGGPLNLAPTKYGPLLQGYTVAQTVSLGTGVPLDDYPDNAEVVDLAPVDTLFTLAADGATEAARLRTLYGKLLGRFSFSTRLRAMTLSIGDVIALEHPRLGWKEWDSGDPSSPDNTDTIDSTLATVVGIETTFGGNNPFPVRLTVARQIPGYYPEGDVT